MSQQRQALILIHGIGEQRPMETLRGFVDAVLDQGPSASRAEPRYYSKPDLLADNLELRRLVSAGGRNDRTDFFEFYWAHLMPTAAWDRLASWYWVLMWRHPKDVPARVKPLYVFSWLLLAVVMVSGLVEVVRFILGYPIAAGPFENAPWMIILLGGLLSMTVRSYVGDAAVYLSPSPRNIEARQKIRASGLTLLDRVVTSGRYDRVIIVGHSLGSVIGYDILTFAWQRHIEAVRRQILNAWHHGNYPERTRAALRKAELVAKEILDCRDPTAEELAALTDKWRDMVWEVHGEQRINGDGWLVTDFITLGSPLAHGALLLARDRPDFERRVREHELPHCPPVLERNDKFSFEDRGTDDQGRRQRAIVLNHAAVFAVVGWTNLYFPCRYVLKGDLIGGAIAPLFGPGVRDIPVATRTWNGWLAHTHYWQRNAADTDPTTAPVQRLREALALERERS